MAIVLVGLGSRGDVQPLAALAARLVEQSHDVRIIALQEFQTLAQASGAEFIPVQGAVADAMPHRELSTRISRSGLGQAWLLNRWTHHLAPAFTDALLSTVTPSDKVITGVLARGAVVALAEARGVPMATVVFTGQVPTLQRESLFGYNYFTGFTPYDRWGGQFAWRLATGIGNPLTAAVRQRLGLTPASTTQTTRDADAHPVLVAASPILVPSAPDWPAGTVQTGWWAPEPTPFEPDPALASWLEREPVYVGYGSFTGFATDADLDLVARAATASGRHVVTPALPGRPPGQLTDHVWTIGPTPHAWLFPRMAGVVHHGGAGTTHAALAAGVPQAVVAFGVDQPYHGWRVHQLGLGPEPTRIHRLTAGRLARLIRQLTTDDQARERAAAIGAQVRAEDGVGAAVETMTGWGWL